MATTKRLSAATRKRTATVHTADGKAKFPINDKKHARLAVQFESRAKPALNPKQRHAVEAKAAKYGVGPLAKKNKVSGKAAPKGR